MVSIVMPVYNGASFMAETLRSVFAQTYGDFQLIVIDDGSTDCSAAIATSTGDPRVTFLPYASNTGIAATVNRGIRASEPSRPFVAFVAADDLLTPDSIARRLDAIGLYDLVCAQSMNIGPTMTFDEFVQQPRRPPTRLRTFYGATIMMRRDVFTRFGLFEESLRHKEDREMWVRLFGRDKTRTDRATFLRLSDVLAARRVHTGCHQATWKRATGEPWRLEIETRFEQLVQLREYNPTAGVELLQ